MDTVQAIVFALIHGFCEFIPVSTFAHDTLITGVLHWQPPTGYLLGSLEVGSFAALFVYFRHDWESMISSLIQFSIYRKKPMTLDERLPFFLFLTTALTLAVLIYSGPQLGELFQSPLWLILSVVGGGILLMIADSMGRKSKGNFDWNIWDSLWIGAFQSLMLLPGCGRAAASFSGGLFRNYRRDSAAKYVFFAAAPILGWSAWTHLKGFTFHASAPMEHVTWLTFFLAGTVAFMTSLLAISLFIVPIERKNFRNTFLYRGLLAAALGLIYWKNGGTFGL